MNALLPEWREFPANKDFYPSMLEYVLSVAKETGLSKHQEKRLRLGFEEATVNIIDYAYAMPESGRLWIRAYPMDNFLILELKDHGIPFNPLQATDALKNRPATLKETKIGGLGISFMRRMFDTATYDYEEENGIGQNHMILGMKIK